VGLHAEGGCWLPCLPHPVRFWSLPRGSGVRPVGMCWYARGGDDLPRVCRAPLSQTAAAQAESEKAAPVDTSSGTAWLASLVQADHAAALRPSAKGKRPSHLSFRFAVAGGPSAADAGGQVVGAATAAAPAAAAPAKTAGAPPLVTRDYKDLVDAVLGRLIAPTPFLAAAVYTPVTQFARIAVAALGASADPRAGGRAALDTFLDSFVAETLLPRVLQDAKLASAAILAHKQAFTASAVVLEHKEAEVAAPNAVAPRSEGLVLQVRCLACVPISVCCVSRSYHVIASAPEPACSLVIRLRLVDMVDEGTAFSKPGPQWLQAQHPLGTCGYRHSR
jgi:hypothetical protein